MYVARVLVQDFRNYSHADVELGPGSMVFLGANGQGKTNLVEAIGYGATLASHRVSSDVPLVRQGRSEALVTVAVVRGDRRARLDMAIRAGGSNEIRLNGHTLPRARDGLGLLRTVLFAPEDLAVIKGEPAGRRRFLDTLLIQRQPRYAAVRSDYDRALRQRNALLRSVARSRRAPDDVARHTLEVWDSQLVGAGAELLVGRTALLAALQAPIDDEYRRLAGGSDPATARYLTDAVIEWPTDGTGTAADAAAEMSQALARRQDEEFRRGVTLIGPHLDDVELVIGGLPAKGYASHGESWSMALSLRLASWQVLTAEADDHGEPVLLLDDVFAELDSRRRERLADRITAAEQVIITAAVAEDVPDVMSGTRISVHEGRLGERSVVV